MPDVAEHTQGDYTFYIRPMDPFKALDLLGDLQKVFLPTIGAALGKADLSGITDEEKRNMTLAKLLKQEVDIKGALLQLSGSINGINLSNFLLRILDAEKISYARGGGEAKKFDKAAQVEVFQGNLSGMFALAWKVLGVNYADFFTMLPSPTGSADESEKT